MPFSTLANKIRKSPLGFAFLNLLFENQRANELLAAAEHTPDGEHNALVVARAVGTIQYSGGSYSVVAGSHPAIVSVASGATGVVAITLDGDYFPSTAIAARFTVISNDLESVPLLASYEVVSTTSVKVYLTKLTSLGGNTWNAVNASFCVALHAQPFESAASSLDFVTPSYRGQNLDAATWNTYVGNQGAQRAAYAVGHTIDGNGRHNVREVAHGFAQAVVDSGGTSYSLAEFENVDPTITRASAGVLTVDLDGARWARPLQPFFAPGYDAANGGEPSDLFVIGVDDALLSSDDSLEVRIFKYDVDANTWSKDDCDFGLTVHTGAA